MPVLSNVSLAIVTQQKMVAQSNLYTFIGGKKNESVHKPNKKTKQKKHLVLVYGKIIVEK